MKDTEHARNLAIARDFIAQARANTTPSPEDVEMWGCDPEPAIMADADPEPLADWLDHAEGNPIAFIAHDGRVVGTGRFITSMPDGICFPYADGETIARYGILPYDAASAVAAIRRKVGQKVGYISRCQIEGLAGEWRRAHGRRGGRR